VITDPFHPGEFLPQVRDLQREYSRLLQQVRRSGWAAAEIRRGGMRRARHDLLGAAQSHDALTIWDKDPETGNRSIRDIKEQEVFFGDVRS